MKILSLTLHYIVYIVYHPLYDLVNKKAANRLKLTAVLPVTYIIFLLHAKYFHFTSYQFLH